MKRKATLTVAGALLAGASATAQTPYMNENYMPTDLIGSARYVGMGGALGALGADMSASSSNPAALGLYRKSDGALTFSVLTQTEKPDLNADMTHMSFDQMGFVLSVPFMSDNVRFVNFGVNYRKKANFNQSFIADNNSLSGLSQTQQMADLLNNTQYYTPLADLMYESFLLNPTDFAHDAQGNVQTDKDGNPLYGSYDALSSDYNNYDRTTEGRIEEYDFSMAVNLKDRVYLGFTMGVDNVDYYSYSTYREFGTIADIQGSSINDFEYYTLYNTQRVSGFGINLKIGAIFRPIEESPFRIGLTMETPTFYHLKSYSSCSIDSPMAEDENGIYATDQYLTYYYYPEDDKHKHKEELRMRIVTPWKVRVSLGHTVGTYLALGAEYEYANYAKTKQGYFDDYDWYYDGLVDYYGTTRDPDMDALHKQTLRESHSFKFGMELNLTKNIAFRAGYNYYSPMFKEEARLDQTGDSPAFDYQTTTDFMNKGEVNIFTAGLGFHGKHFYGDIAYKFRMQSGDFYAFDDTYLEGRLSPVNVNLDTQQVFFTLGYKF